MGGMSGGGGGGGGVPWSQIGASIGETVNTGVAWRQNDKAADAEIAENQNYLTLLDRERDTQAGYFQPYYEGDLAAFNKILGLYGLGSSGFVGSSAYNDAKSAWEKSQQGGGGGARGKWDGLKNDYGIVSGVTGIGGGPGGAVAIDRWRGGGDGGADPISPGRFEDSQQYRDAMSKWRTTSGSGGGGMGDFMALLESSPDYQFARQQGEQALARKQSASGNRLSPGASKELIQYNQSAATMQLGNVLENLFKLAGGGQSAASSLTGVSDRYTDRYGGGIKDRGDIRAAEYLGVASINDRHNQRMQDIWLGGGSGGGGGSQPTSGNRGSTYGGGSSYGANGWGENGYNYGSVADGWSWGG